MSTIIKLNDRESVTLLDLILQEHCFSVHNVKANHFDKTIKNIFEIC